MSDADQRSGGIRLRRLLARTLAVAGITAAGASVAWALGSGVAVAAEHGAGDESPLDSPAVTVKEAARSVVESDAPFPGCEHDVAAFRLGDVKPAALIDAARAGESISDSEPEPAAQYTAPVVSCERPLQEAHHPEGSRTPGTPTAESALGAVTRVTDSVGTVLRRAQPVLEPVRRVGGAVLPPSEGPGSLPDVIGDGWGFVDDPAVGVPGTPGGAPEQPGKSDERDGAVPRPGPRVPENPATPIQPVPHPSPDVHAPSSELPVASVSLVKSGAPFDEQAPGPRRAPRSLPALPPTVPAPAPCPCGADGQLAAGNGSTSGASLAGHAAEHTQLASARVTAARNGSQAPAGGPRPQPGVTPD